MLPSDQVRYRGRYMVRYTPSLHFALHLHCNGAQVVENIGALHVTLQCVAVRCVTPPSIGGVTQQRSNATATEATGGQPSLAPWVMVPRWLLVGVQQAGYLVQLGGYAPQAPVLALAPVPAPPPPTAPGSKNRKIRATACPGPSVGHYHHGFAIRSVTSSSCQEALRFASFGCRLPRFPRSPGGGAGLLLRSGGLAAMAGNRHYVNFPSQCFQSLTCFHDGANKGRKPKLLVIKHLSEQRKGERS
jgi:hypothetical protein